MQKDAYACSAKKCCESFGDNPASNCTRKCLIDIDKESCNRLDGEERNRCRRNAHYECYFLCGNMWDAIDTGFGLYPPQECKSASDAIGGMW